MEEDTIAAIATPFGQGAIAALRVSGERAVEVAGKILRGGGGVATMTPRRSHLREVVDEDGNRVDEVLVTVFEAPASYTGEDVVEISCHGGVLVTQRVLDLLLAAGARPAEPGEFTKRAFLNGRMELTQAEAVMDLISAQTALAMRAANEQLQGRLGEVTLRMREDLIGILAHVEAFIDFPEEDIDPDTGAELCGRIEAVRRSIDDLLSTADQGRILREGVRTVICGEPNVGKSSLLNVLLGFDRAIVSEMAGTTRDTIEEVINLKGIPLRLVDTAGVRESEDAIEREGIARAEEQIAGAELVLEVVDASLPRPAETGANAARFAGLRGEGKARLLVLNKEDLGIHESWKGDAGKGGVPFSCLTREGIDALADRIYGKLTKGDADWSSNPVAINSRHKSCLGRAREYVAAAAAKLGAGESPEFVALELRSGLDAVGEIVGVADVEEILGEIFSSFCIGK